MRSNAYAPKAPKQRGHVGTPFKFSFKELEKKNVIVGSGLAEAQKMLVVFRISMSQPGIFLVAAYPKGSSSATFDTTLKLDDLLELQQQGIANLELESLVLRVSILVGLLKQLFAGVGK